MPKLTTITSGKAAGRAPEADEIKKCLEFPDVAEYLLERLTKKLKSVGLLEKADALIQKVKEYVDVVKQQRSLRGNSWAGDLACERTDFENLQRKLAQDAKELVTQKINQPIKMDFALSDSSQFLRGYSVDGKPLDPQLLDSCDKLFNAWLAENQLVSKEGQIYEATANGEIKKDKNGAAIKADADKMNGLMSDPAKGFQSYLAKRTIQLVTQEHPFPAQKAEVKAAAAPAKREVAPKAAAVAKAQQSQAEERPAEGPGDVSVPTS